MRLLKSKGTNNVIFHYYIIYQPYIRLPIPPSALHSSDQKQNDLWDIVCVSHRWLEISGYFTLAVWGFKKFSRSKDVKSVSSDSEALFLMVLILSCHSKRKLFIFGQYGDTTSI